MKHNTLTPEGLLRFFEPVHSFIDKALASGHNAMVHCLAGAHRAGTTGTSYMMRAAKLDKKNAVRLA